MKKILVTLIAVAIPMISFAFTDCIPGSANICSCVINNCKATFPASSCNYNNLRRMISAIGIDTSCKRQGYTAPNALKQCEESIKDFIGRCH
jgi:hypothetical protein